MTASASPSSRGRFCVGVDENGLGPRLGPLLVTAVMARLDAGTTRAAVNGARGAFSARLGDSKGLVAHRDVALAEAWARAVVERGAGWHTRADSPDALLHALALDHAAVLRSCCPPGLEAQCWSAERDEPSRPEAQSSMLTQVHQDLDALEQLGLEIVCVRSIIVCTRAINEARRAGRSRLLVDLHAMERLVLTMRELAGIDVHAVCGKVGGYQDYEPVFGPLGGRLHSLVEQEPRQSTYRFPGVGEISFVQDADESDVLVGLASLVGKYLRELLMHRIVAHYRKHQPELPDASGYHDPVTSAFIEQTTLARRSRGVPEDCFERQKAEPVAPRRKAPAPKKAQAAPHKRAPGSAARAGSSPKRASSKARPRPS